MEQSFELLSSMSPKIRGRQQTVKINKASKLALKKHFRRSIQFDKSLLVRNEDLAVVEVNTETSESIASSSEGKHKNDIVIIDSTDSEEEVGPKQIAKVKSPGNNDKNTRIRQWLNNVEEGKQNETFFSQASTIYGDNAPNNGNDGNHMAACSSYFDYLTHRFDELFVNKKNDLDKMKAKEDERVDNLSDDSFSLGISVSLTSKLKVTNTSDSSNNKNADKHNVIDDTLLTSDESVLKTTPKNSLPRDEGFVSTRKKRDIQENVNTPSGQSVKDVESMLDSLYGKKWREKQQSVLLPMSEPKKKIAERKVGVPNTERIMKPKIKENLLPNVQPPGKKLNFSKLKKPIESPWMHRLKGLVDSDSDGNTESNSGRDNFTKPKGIEMVKTRLDFSEGSPVESKAKTKENFKKKVATGNKENCPDNASTKVPKKPKSNVKPLNNKNTKKNTKTRSLSTSSSNSCSEEDVSTDEEYEKEIEIIEIKRKSMLPTKNKTYSFLESLSESVPINKCEMSARIFRSCFKQYKEELAKKLFAMFNQKVFASAIPTDTELEWNDKLTKTAGLCHFKRITHKNGEVERKVKITLSTKVVDSADRLRDTLIHEMCHAATWIVNQISDGHGSYWKSWAFKAMETFPELPSIKRCHSYTINSKYTYRCTGCGYSFGRHSKSLDTERKRCGHCYGKFEVLLNKTTKSGQTKTVPITPRKEATGFALFVKENYARHKDPSRKHGDVMKVLGQKFAELKVKKTS